MNNKIPGNLRYELYTYPPPPKGTVSKLSYSNYTCPSFFLSLYTMKKGKEKLTQVVIEPNQG